MTESRDSEPGEFPPPPPPPVPQSQPPPPTGPPLSGPPGPPSGPVQEPDALPALPWGPGRALAALAILLALLAGETVLIAGLFDPELESLGSRLALQVALAATLFGVAFVAANPGSGIATPATLGLRRPTRNWVLPTVGAYFGYIACAVVIVILVAPEQEDVTRELGVDEGTFGAIAAGLLIITVAPLTEEVFFRGFLFAGLRRATPWLVAAVISAGIWALFHYTGPGSWGVVLQLAIFGVWLSWLYQRTGSIWPPIAVHTFNNAVAFAILTS